MHLTNDSPSFTPVHSQIRAIGPRVLHLAMGRGLMETCVTPELSKSKPKQPSGILGEDRTNGTQALNGTGCRPLRDWLWKLLEKNFTNSYACKHQPDHPQFPIDWSITTKWDTDLTRSIFVCSSEAVNFSWALSELPICQSSALPSGVTQEVQRPFPEGE